MNELCTNRAAWEGSSRSDTTAMKPFGRMSHLLIVAACAMLLGVMTPHAKAGSCPGDLNGDGVVGVADLLILLSNWGSCGDPNSCDSHCGGQAPGGCWCDESCISFLDCCQDVCTICPLIACEDSCFGNCDQSAPSGCFCDSACVSFTDCCPDACTVCGHCPKPAVCDTGFSCGEILEACPDSTGGCFCWTGFNGNVVCAQDGTCSGFTTCPTGTCPPGTVCAINTCCADPVCLPVCDPAAAAHESDDASASPGQATASRSASLTR